MQNHSNKQNYFSLKLQQNENRINNSNCNSVCIYGLLIFFCVANVRLFCPHIEVLAKFISWKKIRICDVVLSRLSLPDTMSL